MMQGWASRLWPCRRGMNNTEPGLYSQPRIRFGRTASRLPEQREGKERTETDTLTPLLAVVCQESQFRVVNPKDHSHQCPSPLETPAGWPMLLIHHIPKSILRAQDRQTCPLHGSSDNWRCHPRMPCQPPRDHKQQTQNHKGGVSPSPPCEHLHVSCLKKKPQRQKE